MSSSEPQHDGHSVVPPQGIKLHQLLQQLAAERHWPEMHPDLSATLQGVFGGEALKILLVIN